MSEPTTESRLLPETTARGMRPCCSSTCSSTGGMALSCGKLREVESLFARGHGIDRHVEPVHRVQIGDDFADWLAAPGIEKLLRVVAVPFGQAPLPGFVVERHGVGDGAVAIEEIGAKFADRNFQFYPQKDSLSSEKNSGLNRRFDYFETACNHPQKFSEL